MDRSLGEYIAYQMCDFSEGDFGIKKSLMGLGIGAALGASVLGGVKASNAVGYNKAINPTKIATLQAMQDHYEGLADKYDKLSEEAWKSGNTYGDKQYSDWAYVNRGVSEAARFSKYPGSDIDAGNKISSELDKVHKDVPKETAKGAGAGAGLGAGLAALGKVISDKKKKKGTKENK